MLDKNIYDRLEAIEQLLKKLADSQSLQVRIGYIFKIYLF